MDEEEIADAVKLLLQTGALVGAASEGFSEGDRNCTDAVAVARELKLYRYVSCRCCCCK